MNMSGGNSCALPAPNNILPVNTNNKIRKKKAGTHVASGGSGDKLFNELAE
jgi:hypothetical protein